MDEVAVQRAPRAAQAEALVEIRRVAKSYRRGEQTVPVLTDINLDIGRGDFVALKDCTFDVGANQIVSIVGPSGCGKSTFLRAINRMNDLIPGCRVSGSLLFDGVDIHAADVDVITLQMNHDF